MSDFLFVPAAFVAFLTTAGFMVALRPVAHKLGLVDYSGGRKRHGGTVPNIGGIAIFVGIFAGLGLTLPPLGVLLCVLVASFLLLLIGVLDDRIGIPAAIRLSTQIAVTLIMVYGAGLAINDIGEPFGTGLISMGAATLVFTVAVTVTMVNAYNLIDGADGLAGSLALIAMLAVAAVSGYTSLPGTIALTISAAIVAFLLFNFPTAVSRKVRSFMGDAGSTLLGFTIVWVTVSISQGPERLISPVHCLWFASLPIYDSLTCFVRRSLRRTSPFSPGRDHIHHVLQRGGFGDGQSLGILTGLQLVYATVGVIGHFAGVPDVVMFSAWSVLGLSQRFFIMQIAKLHRLGKIRKFTVPST